MGKLHKRDRKSKRERGELAEVRAWMDAVVGRGTGDEDKPERVVYPPIESAGPLRWHGCQQAGEVNANLERTDLGSDA